TTTRTHRTGQVAGDLEGRASRNGGASARIHDFKETNKGGGSQAGDGTTRPTTCFAARWGSREGVVTFGLRGQRPVHDRGGCRASAPVTGAAFIAAVCSRTR